MVKNKYKLAILILLLCIWAGSAMRLYLPDNSPRIQERVSTGNSKTDNEFNVRMDLLQHEATREQQEPVDIFSVQRVAIATPKAEPKADIFPEILMLQPIVVEEPVVEVTAIEAKTPAKRSETLAKLKFLGFVTNPSGVRVFLSLGEELIIGTAGDILENRIYIKQVNENSITVQDVNTREEVVIEISS